MRRRRQQPPVAAGSRKYLSGKIAGRAPVAQWIEQSPPKGQVARSIRVRGAISYQGLRDYIRLLSLPEVPLRHIPVTVTGVQVATIRQRESGKRQAIVRRKGSYPLRGHS